MLAVENNINDFLKVMVVNWIKTTRDVNDGRKVEIGPSKAESVEISLKEVHLSCGRHENDLDVWAVPKDQAHNDKKKVRNLIRQRAYQKMMTMQK